MQRWICMLLDCDIDGPEGLMRPQGTWPGPAPGGLRLPGPGAATATSRSAATPAGGCPTWLSVATASGSSIVPSSTSSLSTS
jgi:hypothetical protein